MRRAVIFLGVAIYFLALRCYWPVITREDFLPVFPMMFVFLAPFMETLRAAIAARRPSLPAAALPALVLAGELIWLITANPPWINRTANPIRNLEQLLHLTNPDDCVMDSKGETIFRRRPYFYVLETMTRRRIALGLIPNNIIERLIETRTCVAKARRLPADACAFVKANYLPVFDEIRVAGGMLHASGKAEFTVVVPARYSFISHDGATTGLLDGAPCDGPVFLNAGRHVFERAHGSGKLAFVWAQCIERGFSPFAPPDPRDELERQRGHREGIL